LTREKGDPYEDRFGTFSCIFSTFFAKILWNSEKREKVKKKSA